MSDQRILNEGHPFQSFGTGRALHRAENHPPVPEDVEGTTDVIQSVYPWTPVSGKSGQHGYEGPIFHPSEFVGGGLLDWIKAHPAVYVTVAVSDPADPEELVGWMLLQWKQSPTPIDRGDVCSAHPWTEAQTLLTSDYGKVDYDSDDGTTVCTVKVVRSPLTNEYIINVTPHGADDVTVKIERN